MLKDTFHVLISPTVYKFSRYGTSYNAYTLDIRIGKEQQ